MKIKKFDQINEHITDYQYVQGKNAGILQDDDFKKIHRSGRKAYIVNKEYELIEVKSPSDIRNYMYKRNSNFDHVVFLPDDKLESVKGLIKNIGETEKLYKKKINLLFQYVLAFAQKDAEDNNEES